MPMRKPRRRSRLLLIILALAAAGIGIAIWRSNSSEAQQPSGATDSPALVPLTPSSATTRPTPAVPAPAATTKSTTAPTATSTPPVVIVNVTGPSSHESPAALTPTTRPQAQATPATLPSTLPSTLATTHPTTLPAVTSAQAADLLHEAQRLLAAGNLVGARNQLNPAIVAAQLAPADLAALMKLQADINKTLIFSNRRLPGDPWVEGYTVKPGEMLARIAPAYNTTAGFIQRINNIPDAKKLRSGHTIKIVKGPFHAIVNKGSFTLDLYLGAPGGPDSLYVCSYNVGLGQDDSTPLGKWIVEPGKKATNPTYYDPRGGGIIEADDPKNPLGEYWIGLLGVEGDAIGKTSYGIHGTIEPDSIGKMSSLGCVRMRNEEVAVVFDMLIEGKSIVIVKP